MLKMPLSSDSHVTEPPDIYARFIDPEFRDRVPMLQRDPVKGDRIHIPGGGLPISVGVIAAAGKNPKDISNRGATFEQMHAGGWDPKARMADQDRDGIGGEILYPTVGMALCAHPDGDYRRACFRAYNRWLLEYTGAFPDRLWGIAQLQVDTNIDRVLADVREIVAQGFRGVMVPAAPIGWDECDYDHPTYDPLWEALSDLGLPASFHIATGAQYAIGVAKQRGPRLCNMVQILRANQDIIMLMIFGGVFNRHPRLKLVSVEADAGWVPHIMYRMDHVYETHRYWNRAGDLNLQKKPSETIRDNCYFTFQDDVTAYQFKDQLNIKHLLWATDFPHSDSTWPRSMELLERHTHGILDNDERNLIVHDNLVALYNLRLAA